MKPALLLIASGMLCLPGCLMRVGPKTIRQDRFEYSTAISNSWKTQMLMNLVKMRYMEPPLFMDVAQVVTQYTWEVGADVSTSAWFTDPRLPGVNVNGRWSESPTITYNPMTGEKYTKSILQPVAPVSVLELAQAGWSIDTVFALAVRSINLKTAVRW
jgi:hypothetical protein